MISAIIKAILTRDKETLYEKKKKNCLATIYQTHCTLIYSQCTSNTMRFFSALSFSLSFSLPLCIFAPSLTSLMVTAHMCGCVCVIHVCFALRSTYTHYAPSITHTHSLDGASRATGDDLLISSAVLSLQKISRK